LNAEQSSPTNSMKLESTSSHLKQQTNMGGFKDPAVAKVLPSHLPTYSMRRQR
jgi:hypothetical protein